MSQSVSNNDDPTNACMVSGSESKSEEDVLLESLQASRQDQDVYEEQVIREATLQLAPKLTGFGFPALDSLIHSSGSNVKAAKQQASSDLPHLHAVLANTRKAQLRHQQEEQEQPENHDMLFLKEQILLEYMHTIAQTPTEDLPIRRNEDQWLLKRQQAEREPRDHLLQSGKSQKEHSTNYNGIQSTRPRAVKFATSSIGKTTGHRVGRVSIMKRKNQEESLSEDRSHRIGCQNGGGRNENGDDEDDDPQQSREELKRLRNERRKLREARRRSRQERFESHQSSSGEEEVFSVNAPSNIQTITADHVDPVLDQNIPCLGKETIDTTTKDATTKTSDMTKEDDREDSKQPYMAKWLPCPICSSQVDYVSESEKDAALAVHMGSCQEQGPTRRSRRLCMNKMASYSNNLQDSDCDDEALPDVVARQTPQKRKRNQEKSGTQAKTQKLRDPLDDLDEVDYEDRADDWIYSGISKMREMAELDDSNDDLGAKDYGCGLVVPAWINDRLFGYQREGLGVMWEWHKQEAGGILGDEMGLGKTVSVSAYLGSLASCRKLRSCLIVVPATMLNHWLSELATWAPGLRRVLIHSSAELDQIPRVLTPKLLKSLETWLRNCRASRVNECIDEEDREKLPAHSFCGTGYAILTTYENFRRNASVYVGHNFSYIVLDEAQKIRNPDADITLACKQFRTPHRIAMSGTPIMNDLKELWSIVDFCFPGRLGTLPAFEQEFADPIRKGGYSNASPMQAQLAYRCALVLRDLVEPYLLRRLKKDVKEVSRMPSKTENVLFCRLTKRQRSLYESYLRSDEVSKVMRGTNNLLGAITMLRKICNHPDLVCDPSESSLERVLKKGFSNTGVESSDEEGDDDENIDEKETLVERSGKLEVLSKILPLWKKQGHRVLIFCQWRKMLNIVQQFMVMQGWKFGRLDGNTNISARQRLVDEFNSDESYFAMLCTTRTGGVGLNLTGASRVCLYSPDWNPQIDAQARERAWRFGQKKDVTVYRLITAGTVEEKIYQRQIFKTALSNRILQDPRQKRLFSQRDLRDLFTLKQDNGSITWGGVGVTETGEKTRGAGVVNVDNREDEANLQDVMKSKGLAGIFDHHIVESGSSSKAVSAKEMEEQAKRVAQEAARALRQSVSSEHRTSGGITRNTQQLRFGMSSESLFKSSGANFGGPSHGLLSSLKQRAATVNGTGTAAETIVNLDEYTELLRRIKTYVMKRRPTTDAILKDFSDIPSDDIAIFRRLLKSVAKLKNGRWVCNE
ncbi:hypothetical protein ACA910_000019 [Epithemia clementina (nom. ined.)]